jgi:hypothetical protein
MAQARSTVSGGKMKGSPASAILASHGKNRRIAARLRSARLGKRSGLERRIGLLYVVAGKDCRITLAMPSARMNIGTTRR